MVTSAFLLLSVTQEKMGNGRKCSVPDCHAHPGSNHISMYGVRRPEFAKTDADRKDRELLTHFILAMRGNTEATQSMLKREWLVYFKNYPAILSDEGGAK